MLGGTIPVRSTTVSDPKRLHFPIKEIEAALLSVNLMTFGIGTLRVRENGWGRLPFFL
jgi:hypothetical protein